MKVSDDDEPFSYPCFKSGCPLSFEDVAARKEHLLRDHSWRMTADADLKAYQQRREAAYKAVRRKERAEQLQEEAEKIESKRRRKGSRPMSGIGGWSGYWGYSNGQHKKKFSEDDRRNQDEARVLGRQDDTTLKFP